MSRQVSIRISLDGKTEIVSGEKEIGDAGEAMGRKVASGLDAATSAMGKYEQSTRRAAQAAKDYAPGDFGGAPRTSAAYREYVDEQEALAARQKKIRDDIASYVGVPSGKSAANSAAVFAAEDARQNRIAALKASQAGESFQSSLNAFMGIDTPVEKSARDSAAVFEEESRQLEALAARADIVRAQIDPLTSAQERLAKETAEYDRMVSANLLTEKQHAAALTASKQRYEQVAATQARLASGVKLSSFQMANLTYQVNDVVSGLAMGQRPLSVMLQQGGQIYQVFAGSGMGVMGALKATAATIGSMVSPTVMLAGSIAAVGAGMAYLEYVGIKTGKELDAALTGTGRAAGVTAAQLNEMAISAAKGTDVSVGKARTWAEQAAKTGKLPGPAIQRVTELIPDYAATTGQDEDAAAKELIGAYSDLGKGIDTLDAKTGAYDEKTKLLVKTLAEEGQYAEAVRIAYEKMKPALADHMEQMTAWGRFWHGVGTGFSDFFDARAMSSNEKQVKDQIAYFETLRKEAQKNGGHVYVPGENEKSSAGQTWNLGEIEAQLSALTQKQRQETKKSTDDAREQWAKVKADLAEPILLKVVPAVQEAEFRRELGAQHYNLRNALGDPGALKKFGLATRDDALEGMSAVERANRTYLPETDRILQQQKINEDAVRAQTPAQKAAIAARRESLALSGQEISDKDAAKRIQSAYDEALSSGNYELSQQNRLLNANIRETNAVAEAWLKSGAAAMQATAHQQALQEFIQSGISVAQRERQILEQNVADRNSGVAQQISKLQTEMAVRQKINDAVSAGTLSYVDANREMQIGNALIDLRIAKEIAVKLNLTKQAALIQSIVDNYEKTARGSDAATRRTSALQEIAQGEDQLAALKAQSEMAMRRGFVNPQEMQMAKLMLDRNSLLEKGYAIVKDGNVALTVEGKQWMQIQHDIMGVNQQLERTKAANDMIYNAEASIFDRLEDLMGNSKSKWTDYLKSVYMEFEKTAARLMIVNPLKNWILGGDANDNKLPTMADTGGWLGELLGNKTDNEVKADGSADHPYYVIQKPINGTATTTATTTGEGGQTVPVSTGEGGVSSSGLMEGADNQSGISNTADFAKRLFEDTFRSNIAGMIAVMAGGSKNKLRDMLIYTAANAFATKGGIFDSIMAEVHHVGGVAGMGTNDNRELPSNVFRLAPRFHDGVDLRPDEIPAILQSGERVLNREQNRRYNETSGGTVSNVTMNVTTPDAGSFRQSRGQMLASLSRAVQSGMRRN